MAELSYGFINYDSGHSSIIASASLDGAGNLGTYTLDGAGAAAPVYDNGGIVLDTDLLVNFAPSAAQKATLATGGHIRFEIESSFLDIAHTADGGTNEYICGLVAATGNSIGIYKPNSSVYMKMVDATGPASVSGLIRIESDTKSEFTEVIMSWHGKTAICYIDRFYAIQLDTAKISTTAINNVRLGAVVNGAQGPQQFVAKNFHISTQPIHFSYAYGMSHIAIIGHSFSDDMDYPSTNSQIVGDKANGAQGDITGLCNLHRRLARMGWLIPQGKIRNEGVGGAILSGYTAQIDNLLTKVTHLDVVICQMGTNDAANPISGTYQADYQVHIDRLIDNGARTIVLINTITRNTNPSFSGAPYEGRVDELNVIHQALADANPECHLVDAFTKFGGHDNWPAAWVNAASPTHPNDLGYTKIAEWTADVLIPQIAAI